MRGVFHGDEWCPPGSGLQGSANAVGVRLEVHTGLDSFPFLWSESATRSVVLVLQNRNDEYLALCDAKSFPVTRIGSVDCLSNSIELAGIFGETKSIDQWILTNFA
jgi:hypothetical protein